MNLNPIKANLTHVEQRPGLDLYFSYKTLVAVRKDGKRFKTDVHYSRTTSKHITQIDFKDATPVSQEVLESMARD